MSKSRNLHVVHRSNGWAVQREGAQRASSTHKTQAAAAASAQSTAKREHGETFIHRLDGPIRDRNSYGNDPHPPKG